MCASGFTPRATAEGTGVRSTAAHPRRRSAPPSTKRARHSSSPAGFSAMRRCSPGLGRLLLRGRTLLLPRHRYAPHRLRITALGTSASQAGTSPPVPPRAPPHFPPAACPLPPGTGRCSTTQPRRGVEGEVPLRGLERRPRSLSFPLSAAFLDARPAQMASKVKSPWELRRLHGRSYTGGGGLRSRTRRRRAPRNRPHPGTHKHDGRSKRQVRRTPTQQSERPHRQLR
jgi:hypothetical protein